MEKNSKIKLSHVNLFSVSYSPVTLSECDTKSPIIFLHGILSTPYTWEKVKTSVCNSSNRKGYAIALRNHCQSGYSDEYTVDLLAEDLRHFMLKENIEKAILVGHSMGGRVAMTFALQRPEMVEKLIVEDTSLKTNESQKQLSDRITNIIKQVWKKVTQFPPTLSEREAHNRISKIMSFSLKNVMKEYLDIKPCVPAMILPFHKEVSGQFVWDANMSVMSEFDVHDFDLDLSTNPVYTGKTLFLSAEHSTIDLFKEEDILKKHFPNFQIIVGKNVFHIYHREKPDEYVDHLVQFIGVENSKSI